VNTMTYMADQREDTVHFSCYICEYDDIFFFLNVNLNNLYAIQLQCLHYNILLFLLKGGNKGLTGRQYRKI
jgi:hypothetical protein